MAQLVTGRRSTEGCRTSLDQPLQMRSISTTHNTGGHVDPSTMLDKRAWKIAGYRNAEKRATIAKRKSRHRNHPQNKVR